MRILVVEDYAPVRLAVVKGLRHAGYSVDSCANGVEGKWYAETNDFDVILLDLMLPEMDGLTILRKLRESNIVDVYIFYLRKKIDRPGWKKLIHTRRGLGYLLGTPS